MTAGPTIGGDEGVVSAPLPRPPRPAGRRPVGAHRPAQRQPEPESRPAVDEVPVAGWRGIATFRAFRSRNFRLFFVGQTISLIGTWMQSVAQAWLVLTLTGSGTALGFVVGLQFLPVLLLGAYGGVIADRADKRLLLVATQSSMAVLALILGVLTVIHQVTLWEVYLLAAALGLVNVFDNPARQSFVLEMVGAPDLGNAVSLNSVLVNAARAVGPAIAGILIAGVGVGVCFLANAASFLAVIISLLAMNAAALYRGAPTRRAGGQIREGFRYVRSSPGLLVPLLMMALVGTLAYEFSVVLPLLARITFHGGAPVYGFLTAAMGGGAVIGGLVVASRSRTGKYPVIVTAAVFGVVILLAAAAPTLPIELGVMALVGAASVAFLAVGNSTLQLGSSAAMRGRVMALWAVAFLGTTPIGGPVAGFVSGHLGPRYGLLMGGLACLVAAGVGLASTSWRPGRAVPPPGVA